MPLVLLIARLFYFFCTGNERFLENLLASFLSVSTSFSIECQYVFLVSIKHLVDVLFLYLDEKWSAVLANEHVFYCL